MDLVDSCYKCPSFNRCLDFALYNDNVTVKCMCYGALKNMAKETLDKLNEIKKQYLLTKGEIKKYEED